MIKKYKITTCASVNAIGGTISSGIRGNSASNGIDGGTGCNFIFFLHRKSQFHQGNVGQFYYNLDMTSNTLVIEKLLLSHCHFQNEDVIKIRINVSDTTPTIFQQFEVSL